MRMLNQWSLLVVACVAMAQTSATGQVVLVDDFESYTAGTSIDGQGAWEAQANTSMRDDSENSNVIAFGGSNVLEMVNRDNLLPHAGTLQTVYTSMELPSPISQGTIYMRWLKTSEGADPVTGASASPATGDMILATNGRPAGFDPDGDTFLASGGIPANEGQEAANYGDQAALVRLGADAAGDDFRARNNTAYENVASGIAGNLLEDQWYEMWMHVDQTANQQTRYYIAEDGGTPQLVQNAGGDDWWGHRNDSYSTATVIKFLHGSFGQTTESTVYVDTVGVDLTGWSTNSLVPEPTSLLLLAMGGVSCLVATGRRRS